MFSAKNIELLTHGYEFMIKFQELDEISTQKRQPEEYIFAFQNHVLDGGVAFAEACNERLPRFLGLVF